MFVARGNVSRNARFMGISRSNRSDLVAVIFSTKWDLHGWYYVGVETESEAHGLVGKKRPGETFIGAKRIKNVEHVKAHELRPVPIGDYWGPLIPE